jgi:hypothetical protein
MGRSEVAGEQSARRLPETERYRQPLGGRLPPKNLRHGVVDDLDPQGDARVADVVHL